MCRINLSVEFGFPDTTTLQLLTLSGVFSCVILDVVELSSPRAVGSLPKLER